ncbi:MAG TPA: hypothetical protein VJQ57_10830 [Acidimicrobiia bacterium]|nr:hypothetical protein [Acidimicrobiia bacterium]
MGDRLIPETPKLGLLTRHSPSNGLLTLRGAFIFERGCQRTLAGHPFEGPVAADHFPGNRLDLATALRAKADLKFSLGTMECSVNSANLGTPMLVNETPAHAKGRITYDRSIEYFARGYRQAGLDEDLFTSLFARRRDRRVCFGVRRTLAYISASAEAYNQNRQRYRKNV